MSYQNVNHHSLSLVAGADLSAAQFRALKVNTSGAAVLAGAGEFSIGILQNNPAAGQAATIATVGAISKARAGGNINAGATVAVNASGQLVDAAEAVVNTSDAGAAADPVIGSNIVGVALESASSGQIFAVLVTLSGATPTTAA